MNLIGRPDSCAYAGVSANAHAASVVRATTIAHSRGANITISGARKGAKSCARDACNFDANLTVAEQEGLNVGALMYNTQQKPFDDVRVRKALNMAINKKAIIDAVFQGAHLRVQARSEGSEQSFVLRLPPTSVAAPGTKLSLSCQPEDLVAVSS